MLQLAWIGTFLDKWPTLVRTSTFWMPLLWAKNPSTPIKSSELGFRFAEKQIETTGPARDRRTTHPHPATRRISIGHYPGASARPLIMWHIVFFTHVDSEKAPSSPGPTSRGDSPRVMIPVTSRGHQILKREHDVGPPEHGGRDRFSLPKRESTHRFSNIMLIRIIL